MVETRERYQMNDADLGSDELEVVVDTDGVCLTVEEPWAGDTETGFGRSCSIRFSKKSARDFANWLFKNCS